VDTGRALDEATPLLQNRRGCWLKRHGARYLLLKYVKRARLSLPHLNRLRVNPHTLRHTKALHLLQQSGVPLTTIKEIPLRSYCRQRGAVVDTVTSTLICAVVSTASDTYAHSV
jgi:hypothetical protein